MPRAPHALFLVAAEPSADVLAARLLPHLRRAAPPFALHGVYGPRTAAAAAAAGVPAAGPLFPPADLAVMGVASVVRALPRLALRIRALARAVAAVEPRVLLCVDNKGVSRRVAARVRSVPDLSIVQYVAPSLYAWRHPPHAAAATAALYDHLLLLYPFEAASWAAAGVPTTVVGPASIEPYLPSAARPLPRPPPRADDPHSLNLAVMLGSRAAEVAAHGPLVTAALPLLPAATLARVASLTVPIAAPHLRAEAAAHARRWERLLTHPRRRVRLVDATAADGAVGALARASCAVLCSGTAVLDAALAGCAGVLVYRTGWPTGVLARSLAKVRFAGLTNLIAGEPIVPELLFESCTAGRLAGELEGLLAVDGRVREERGRRGREAVAGLLDLGSPSAKAAGVIARLLRRADSAGRARG
jgi:lipid-A-disaccharide synthase